MEHVIKRAFCLLLLLVVVQASLYSIPESSEPVPYMREEFPEWAHGLRRYSVITLGVLPIVSMVTVLAYDGIMGTTDLSTQDDIRNKMMVTVSASMVIGLADLIIHYTGKNK